jgi:hypothetical protein
LHVCFAHIFLPLSLSAHIMELESSFDIDSNFGENSGFFPKSSHQISPIYILGGGGGGSGGSMQPSTTASTFFFSPLTVHLLIQDVSGDANTHLGATHYRLLAICNVQM